MAGVVKPIPEGYHSVTPYLFVNNAAAAIEFYKKAFGAKELMRCAQPDGKVNHAEISIGDSRMMLADECPQMKVHSPVKFGGTPVLIHLYVENVDIIFKQAVAAGATVTREVENHFWGDRSGGITDPFGHMWCISSHVEDVSEEEMKKRMEEFSKQMAEKMT